MLVLHIFIYLNYADEFKTKLIAVIDYAAKAEEIELTPANINRIKSAVVFNRQYLMYLDALNVTMNSTNLMIINIIYSRSKSVKLEKNCKY